MPGQVPSSEEDSELLLIGSRNKTKQNKIKRFQWVSSLFTNVSDRINKILFNKRALIVVLPIQVQRTTFKSFRKLTSTIQHFDNTVWRLVASQRICWGHNHKMKQNLAQRYFLKLKINLRRFSGVTTGRRWHNFEFSSACLDNSSFPRSKNSYCQKEAKCKIYLEKMSSFPYQQLRT